MRFIYTGIGVWIIGFIIKSILDYSRYNVFKWTENILESLISAIFITLISWLTTNRKKEIKH
ncbi:hypothetical protein OKW24_000827 [Peribacillus simplex]|nr:hypothetical protein [Peribacillus simplex]